MQRRDAAVEIHREHGNHPRAGEIRHLMRTRLAISIAAVVILAALFLPANLPAQESHENDPASALVGALSAACRANENDFANYLTTDNAAAFRALPKEQRAALMRRLSLADNVGKLLISADQQNHPVLRCSAPEGTAEFRFGDVRIRENLAFVPVQVVDSQKTEFGLVRENGGWRLISLGLVLLDIPQLSKQWAEGDLAAREDAAITTLRSLGDAIQTYRRAYGKLPDSLVELGPAPKGQISPEQAALVNESLATGSEGGYRFRYRIASAAESEVSSFEILALPEAYGKTGKRSFFLDVDGKVHGADNRGGLASANDPLVAESPQ